MNPNPSILGRVMGGGGFQRKYTPLSSGEFPTNPDQGPSNIVRQSAYERGDLILPDIDGFNRGTTRPSLASMLAPSPASMGIPPPPLPGMSGSPSPMMPPSPMMGPPPAPQMGPPRGLGPSAPPMSMPPSMPPQMQGPPMMPPQGIPPRRLPY